MIYAYGLQNWWSGFGYRYKFNWNEPNLLFLNPSIQFSGKDLTPDTGHVVNIKHISFFLI